MTHFVDPKNYFGTGRAPPPARSPADAARGPSATRGRWVHEGHGTPSLQIPADRRAGRLPVARDVVQSHCSRFQLGPYPFRPPAGFVMQRKLLKEPRQTDRKPSLSLLGHIVCPGLNLNIKRPYLFLLFINPEPCALKPRLGRVQERARGRAASVVWTKVRLRCVRWDQGRLGCSVP